MKLYKILFALAFLFSPLLTYSQSNKIAIKTILLVEDQVCGEEKVIRNIDIQILNNNNFTSIKKFQTDQCTMVYTVSKYKGRFKAVVSAEKYRTSEINFEINETSLDTLVLKTTLQRSDKPKVLNEVIVQSTSSVNPIKIEGNKTTYAVQNNDALNNGTVLETIQKLPGVMSDINGNITMKGKTIVVMIDGMPTNMNGQDLTNYLNSMSSSSISKLEIINNPGATYDADISGDVINVITGQKKKRGFFGSIYSATTFYKRLKSENALTLNGQYGKVNWNSNFSYHDSESESGMRKTIVDQNNESFITDENLNQNKTKPIQIRTGISFPLKSNIIDLRYSHAHNNQETLGNSNYFGYVFPVVTYQESFGRQLMKSNRNEFTSILTHKFKNPEQLFTLNYQFYNFNRDRDTQNTSILNGSDYQTNNSIAFRSRFNKLNADFILPMTSYKISTGIKYTTASIYSKGHYEFINDVNNSNNNILYHYDDFTLAGYGEFYKKYKKIDLTVGVRYEYIDFDNETNAIVNGAKKYSNFFPSFNIGYHLNTSTNLNLSYARKVKLPGYQELDPNSSGIPNQLVSEQGNPLLKPAFYHNAQFKIDFFKYAYIDFSYSNAKNENYYVIVKDSQNSYNQTYDQFNNVQMFNTSIALPVPLGIFTKGLGYLKSITDINSLNYAYIVAGSNRTTFDKEDYNTQFHSLYYIGTYTQFILPFDTKMNLQYTYSSKGNYTIYNVEKDYHKLDVTLSKSMFHKTTKIQFSFTDILKTAEGFHAAFVNNALHANVQTRFDSQRIKFSLTYTFGSYKAEPKNAIEEVDERENEKSSIQLN